MNAIQHISFNCRDLKAQEQFYTKHFGFRSSRVFNADTPEEFIILRLGAMCLELFSADGDTEGLKAQEPPIGF